MDDLTIINHKKPCPVCIYLKSYSKEFVLEIDSLIFSNGKYKDILLLLEKSKILNNKQKPTKHFVEKHRTDCLSDFIFKEDITKTVSIKNECLTNPDLQVHLDKYRKMSVQERDTVHIERLREIKYMVGINVHQQLLNGDNKKLIPKEDISALKQIEDIVHSLKLDTKLEDLNINMKSIGEDIE